MANCKYCNKGKNARDYFLTKFCIIWYDLDQAMGLKYTFIDKMMANLGVNYK